MMRVLQCLFLIALAYASHDIRPSVASRTCPVIKYGARCDGTTDDTATIQAALDACSYHRGTVMLPPNQTCLSFPLDFQNGTSLFLPAHATLKAFPDVTKWAHQTRFNFVELRHRRDIAIFGSGTIDGSGEQWWVMNITVCPRLFHMSNVHNISFRGITMTNTGAMTLSFGSPCSNALVESVTIVNPAVGNTDGIDMGCDGALIQNTVVVNGDDSICMKGGAKNVLVRNCSVFNGIPYPSSVLPGKAGGLVLGTSDSDSMHNITYTNCTVTGALAGIRIKFRPSQSGYVRDVHFEGIRVLQPSAYAVDLLLNSDHIASEHSLTEAAVGCGVVGVGANVRTVCVNNITLSDIWGQLALESRAVARFHCTSDFPCSGIKLDRFNISGFMPSTKYPVPCEWTFAAGEGSHVLPLECSPPA